jgi:replicative DNA helicase
MHDLSHIQASRQMGGLLPAKSAIKDWFTDLNRRYEMGDKVTGLPTPWHDLNAATHGLQNGELTIIAARTNMGKSVMGGQLAMFSALRGVRVALFSLEMTRAQVIRRSVSALANIPHDWLMAPGNDGDDAYWTRLTNATAQLNDSPLLIDDAPGLTIEQLSARARRAHMQDPIGLIVVDHLHEMLVNPDRAVIDTGRNAQGIKSLAKEFNCPAVALAQLNRALGQRADKRPTMTDLRQSGELEQKADVILFLHREDYYDRETHLQGVVEVELGKGRDIKTGTRIHLANRYDVMRLDDWDGPLPEASVHEHAPRRRGLGTGMPS